MGPRPFSRGNIESRKPCTVHHLASMGPRPFSRGNKSSRLLLYGFQSTLQWGHDLSAVETPPSSAGSAGDNCFNGATTFQPWKHVHLPNWKERNILASMGPRPFSRGNLAKSLTGRAKLLSFNGATTFQPWKLDQWRTSRPLTCSFNGATTFQPWKPHHFAGDQFDESPASMGPRPFSRGNLSSSASHARL